MFSLFSLTLDHLIVRSIHIFGFILPEREKLGVVKNAKSCPRLRNMEVMADYHIGQCGHLTDVNLVDDPVR